MVRAASPPGAGARCPPLLRSFNTPQAARILEGKADADLVQKLGRFAEKRLAETQLMLLKLGEAFMQLSVLEADTAAKLKRALAPPKREEEVNGAPA